MLFHQLRRCLFKIVRIIGRLKYWLGFIAVVIYATFVEPVWIETTQNTVGSGEGKLIRIAQISDLHLRDMGRREIAILDRLRAIKPDVVIFSGDIVDRADALPVLEKFLAAVTAKHKLAVLGNWEYWGNINLEMLRQTYARQGVSLLVNQSAQVMIEEHTLLVVGLDDATAGKPVLSAIERSANAIFVEHSPGWIDGQQSMVSANKFRLILSGHTHGGQISFIGIPFWTPPGSGKYVHGHYDTDLGPLYVSRGLGTSGPPVRFGARPEVPVFGFYLSAR